MKVLEPLEPKLRHVKQNADFIVTLIGVVGARATRRGASR